MYTSCPLPCSIVSMAAAASESAGLPRILPSQATTVSAPSTRVSVIVVSPLFCSGSQTPLTASFSHTASAFCADSSSTTFAGFVEVIFSSVSLTTTSKSSPICVRSSRLLGEADASMIFLFMMCLRDKSSAFDGRFSRSLLCFLNGLQAERILGIEQLLSSLVLLLIAAIRL